MHSSKQKLIGNLPTALSTFIGRRREITEVEKLVSTQRLLTLTGVGGSGKTRLALMVAHELLGAFDHGVWFIELASISDPQLIPQTAASALNLREEAGQPVLDVLVSQLREREALLVIDNCEHLVSACARFTETLLQKCPALKILATSREVLGLPGEVAWIVPPLSLPEQQPWIDPVSAGDALVNYRASESVQLFVARATSNSPEFQLTAENGAWVAEICRQLDGIPLAIELAAARVRSLSVQQIAQRLDDRFHLLTGGSRTAPPRQQTLLSTLDWSYTLLSDVEQKVLQRLSVFAGGATLDAAESICAGEGIESTEVLNALSHLVDKSLVLVEKPRSGETLYRLLETIRQYALEKLAESGHLEASKNRHLNHFIDWAESAEPHLVGPEQVEWLERYEAEHDNLRAALDFCSTDDGKAEDGLRLVAACGRFWRLHGYLSEGRRHLTYALSRSGAQRRTKTRARALTFLANHAYLQSDYPAMRPLAEEALSIWRELGEAGLGGAAFTLDLLGELATEEGDFAHAPRFFEEALEIYQKIQDATGIGEIHMQFGWAAIRTGEYEEAQHHLEEFLRLAQQVQDKTSITFAFSGLGEVAVRQGNLERAVSLLEQALALNQQRGDKWGTGTCLGSLGWVALQRRDFKQMRKYLEASLSIRLELRDRGGIAWCLEKLGQANHEQARFQDAAKLFGHAEAIRAPMGSVMDPADQPRYHRTVSELQSALGMDAFAAAWSEGKSMPLEDVIELALSEPNIESSRTEKEKYGGLTAREREVATLIAQGKSNREIAEAMTVSAKTIETYVTRILSKLGFDSRVQIATWAIEKGLK